MYINDHEQAVFPVNKCENIFDIGQLLNRGRSQGQKSDQVLIDWTQSSFVGISVLTAIVAMQLRIKTKGYGVCVAPPRESDNVDRYISRMNYYKCIGISRDENFVRHDEGDRFIPVTPFSSQDNRNELPDKVSQTIVAHTPLADEAKVAVNYIFGEVIDNVCEHSRSKNGGFIGTQFYPQVHMLELCIADGGCGIPQSLRRNPLFADFPDADLLPKALECGIGENVEGERGSQGYGKGKGLAIISNMVRCIEGTMRIISGEAAIEMGSGRIRNIPNSYFPGTVVSIELPTNSLHKVSATELFDGLEGSVLLDTLFEKYGVGNENKENEQNVLW